MIPVYINNNFLLVPKTASVLEACEIFNINVPRFCYHPELYVAGNCRMCLVEIEKSPKPVASCAMPVTKNMKIFTNSPLVKKARENILEFLLLNHPLDCPICDQGGECDLQEQSLTFGSDKTRFFNFKRTVHDKNLGVIIKTIMTRCIHCTRCVRFISDVIGKNIFGTINRGNDSEIGVYITKNIQNELSGNLVDICPVGALTAKPYAFSARPWELRNIKTIDLTDAVGSFVSVDFKDTEILRIQPKQNNLVNRVWLSNKGRFYFDSFKNNRLNKFFFKSTTKNKLISICSTDFIIIFKKIIKLFFLKNSLIHKIHKINKNIFYYSNFLNNFSIITTDFLCLEEMFDLKLFCSNFGIKNTGNIDLKRSNNNIDFNGFNSSLLKISFLPTIDFCVLIGTNPRFEISVFNIQLKKRFSFGLFNVISSTPFVKPTFSTIFIGISNLFIIKWLEGQTNFCKITVVKTTIFFIGCSVFNRFDNTILANILYLIKNNNVTINFINNHVNSVGRFFCNINGINKQLLHKSKIIYLINPQINQLKYNSYNIFDNQNKIILHQSEHNLILNKFKTDIAIPNVPIIYNNGHFISFNNNVQKTNKIKKATNNITLNQFLNIVKSILHLSYIKLFTLKYSNNTNKLINCSIPTIYENTTNFKYIFYFKNEIQCFSFCTTKFFKQIKIGRNPFLISIYDFYSTDNFSLLSKTLNKCSSVERIKHTNFY